MSVSFSLCLRLCLCLSVSLSPSLSPSLSLSPLIHSASDILLSSSSFSCRLLLFSSFSPPSFLSQLPNLTAVNTPTQEVALIAKLGSIKIKTDRTHVLPAQLATTVHLAPIIPRLVQLEPLALLPDSKRQRARQRVSSDNIALLDQPVVQRALLVSTVV